MTIPLPHPVKTVADPAATMDYGYKNYRLFAGDRTHYEKFDGAETSLSIWNNPAANSQRFEKESGGTLKYLNNYLNYGIDWFINDKYRSLYITYRRENRRDFLILFGAEKKFSKKVAVNILYVPFLTDFIPQMR